MVCKFHTIFYVFYDLGCCNRLTDLFHGIFEFLTVLCLRLSQLLYRSALHCALSRILSLQAPWQGSVLPVHPSVGSTLSGFSFRMSCSTTSTVNGSMYTSSAISLSVMMVAGLEFKDNLHAFFFQGTACLCSCIVKLCCLSDDNRTRTNYKYFFNIFILGIISSSIISINLSNR